MLSERRPPLPARHLGTVQVFTFKKGVLSRLAHDLRLTVEHFDVELRNGRVRARLDVASARVDGVVVGDRVDETKFSRQDTEVIERNMRDAILAADRFPSIDVEGEVKPAGTGWILSGKLTMVGHTCPIEVPLVRSGSDVVVDIDITPTQWGIRPFTTMGGAIGIEDRWRIYAKFALGGDSPAELLRPDALARWSS